MYMAMKKILVISVFLMLAFAVLSTGCKSATVTTIVTSISVTSSDNSQLTLQDSIPLTVTQPKDGDDITGNTVDVVGQTEAGATITIGDQTVISDAEGNFSITVNLSSGLNAIDVIAIDGSGRQGEVLLMVNAITQ